MKIYVDIDNTICKTHGNDYHNAKPLQNKINKVNAMFEEGHHITYWTARGGTSGIDWTDFTREQLEGWGCKFHKLLMGKPSFDILYDDKASIL